MTASSFVGVAWLGVALAGCGGAAGSRPAPPTSEARPPARAEAPADDADGGPAPAEPCRRGWPRATEDPRAGFYVFARRLSERFPEDQNIYRFDGDSLTMIWFPSYLHRPICRWGGPDDVPRTAVLRLRAFVDDQRRLWALTPCYGWMQVGRFEEDGTLVSHLDAELRRVPREREGLLSEHPYAPTFLDDFFVCREDYVPPGAPAPPPRPTTGE